MKKRQITAVCVFLIILVALAYVLFVHDWGTEDMLPQGSTEGSSSVEGTGNMPGESTSGTGDAHVHQWSETVIPPTCTEDGHTTFTCACGESYTDNKSQALGHAWKAATCTSPKTCTGCGATEGKATDHTWDTGRVTKQPTKTEEGETLFTCTACGGTKTQPIPVVNSIIDPAILGRWVSPECWGPIDPEDPILMGYGPFTADVYGYVAGSNLTLREDGTFVEWDAVSIMLYYADGTNVGIVGAGSLCTEGTYTFDGSTFVKTITHEEDYPGHLYELATPRVYSYSASISNGVLHLDSKKHYQGSNDELAKRLIQELQQSST